MEQRLIDANALKKEVGSTFHGAIGLTITGAVHEIIDRQPTIDPESLRSHCKTMLESGEIWERDCEALGMAIAALRGQTAATNADCIRAMSDEKLANQLVIEVDGLEPCRLYLSAPTGKLYVTRTEATRNALEWLQQPTEED